METIVKTGMGALLLAAIPVDGDPGLWAQWGLAGAVVGYTLWRDWQRERQMRDSTELQNEWVRNTLVKALERNSVAMEKVVERMPNLTVQEKP